MKEKLWLGAAACGIAVFVAAGLLSYDLFREVETSAAGVRTTATVLSVDHAGDDREHVVSFLWDGRPREATTAWIPDGVWQGAVIDVAVNRRDPGFLIADGTAAQRFGDYGVYVVMMAVLGLGLLGFLRWLRHEYPDDVRRPARIAGNAPPNRAARRALRRRRR